PAVRQSSIESDSENIANDASEAAKALSNLGASKGGEARARKLSPERRREIARAAVETRWAKTGKEPIPQATHIAELKIGDVIIPCALLEDGTRLLTQWGFYRAIGRSGRPAGGRGSSVEKVAPFLALNNVKPYVSSELADSTKPISFRLPNGTRAYGYRAELLPQVCEVYLKAREESVLLKSQLKFAHACEILARGLAHVGIPECPLGTSGLGRRICIAASLCIGSGVYRQACTSSSEVRQSTSAYGPRSAATSFGNVRRAARSTFHCSDWSRETSASRHRW